MSILTHDRLIVFSIFSRASRILFRSAFISWSSVASTIAWRSCSAVIVNSSENVRPREFLNEMVPVYVVSSFVLMGRDQDGCALTFRNHRDGFGTEGNWLSVSAK
jgi:hypothetical protein